MYPADLFRITQEVESYMQKRESKRLVYNVVNALDKLGYLHDKLDMHEPESVCPQCGGKLDLACLCPGCDTY